jgi:hypothetical protein
MLQKEESGKGTCHRHYMWVQNLIWLINILNNYRNLEIAVHTNSGIHNPQQAESFSKIRIVATALIGGGGVYSYIPVLPDRFQKKSVVF